MLNKRILLDPGHGFNLKKDRYDRPLMHLVDGKAKMVPNSMKSHDCDMKANYYREDFGTAYIALNVEKKLKELGYEVFLTRSMNGIFNAAFHLARKLDNVTKWKKKHWKPWRWIREARKQLDCNTIISIHTNAGGGEGVIGFPRKKLWHKDKLSIQLTSSIVNNIAENTSLTVRGIKPRRYSVLLGSKQGCLVECGFHDNPHDLEILTNPDCIVAIGESIAKGIDEHFKS